MAASTSSSTSSCNSYRHDVFISHRGVDVKKTFASHLYRRLLSHGLTAFLDYEELQVGRHFETEIKEAIRTASVHVAIFSAGYADSEWCLKELVLMLKTGALIIPVFHNVRPTVLRCTRGDGIYAQALDNLKSKKRSDFQPRHELSTIEEWRNALQRVAGISGLELEKFKGDEGVLVDEVVKRVLKKVEKPRLPDVFINHRGVDVKKTFASHLYRSLLSHGLTAFLDYEELQVGRNFETEIKEAIRTASVHVAIFSERYAESEWCLKELVLMLKTGAHIIPVFHNVQPTVLHCARGDGIYAQALDNLKSKPRHELSTIEEWRNALERVGGISGLELEKFEGDEGVLVDEIVKRVLKKRWAWLL